MKIMEPTWAIVGTSVDHDTQEPEKLLMLAEDDKGQLWIKVAVVGPEKLGVWARVGTMPEPHVALWPFVSGMVDR